MKTFLIMTLLLSLSNAFTIEVDGEVFYQLPNGKMAVREVTIDVPPKGQGEVILSGKSFEWKSTKFKSFNKFGQDIFTVVFDTEFEEVKSKQIFKGTYFKTDDHIKYYGNIYEKKAKKKLTYIGGFEFNYPR